MIKKSSLKSNTVLSIANTVCTSVLPLITFPYITRVLQPDNLGKVNFCSSIISYFTLIAGLGINTYTIREGAAVRDDRQKLSRFTSKMFSLNLMMSVIAYILLFVYIGICSLNSAYKNLLLIQSIAILSSTLGVSWIYAIQEDYLYVTIRNIAVQLISFAAVFIFVKSSDDYLVYAGITVFASGAANALNFFYARKYIDIRLTLDIELNRHFTPIMILFANNILTSIYLNSDVTMIGYMVGDTAVGLYQVSVKIYTIVKSLLNAIIVVAIPRFAYYLAQDNRDSFDRLSKVIFKVLLTTAFPALTGLVMLREEIIVMIAGQSYAAGASALGILSIALCFATVANLFINGILVNLKREKIVLVGTIISAVSNICLNFYFIPVWGISGAAVTTLLAECMVAVIGVFSSRDVFSFKGIVRTVLSVTVGCAAIIVICIGLGHLKNHTWRVFFLKIALSVIVYGLIQLLCNRQLIKEIRKI